MSERKSASAYRTISEVAEGLGVPQHVLRFWETKFPAVKPLKRGGNRRYYRPEDIELLQVIHRLLHVDGYTIKGAQKLLKERGVRALVEEFLGGSEAPATTSIQTAAQISAELNAEAEVEAALAEAVIPEALTVDPDVALPETAAPAASQAEAEPALEPNVVAALADAALEVEAVGGSAPVALPVQEAAAEPAPAPVQAVPVQAVPVQDRQAQRQLVLELKSIRAGLADALGGAVPAAG